MAHCHPADGSLVRVERWGFEGKSPKTRVSLLKGGHVLSLNYVLKSDMDLRNEQRAAKEKQLKQEAVRCLLVLKTGLLSPVYQYYLKYNTETGRQKLYSSVWMINSIIPGGSSSSSYTRYWGRFLR